MTYTTAALVQAELRTTDVFSSSTLPTLEQVDNWIAEETRNIDVFAGQTFSSDLNSSEIGDYDGCGSLLLDNAPILSVTSLEYNTKGEGATPVWVTFTEGVDKNFLVYNDEGEVKFISGAARTVSSTPNEGIYKFRTTYTSGYSSTPLEIQGLCTQLVARRVLGTLANSQANTEGGDIQIGVIKVGDPGMFSINYMESLDTSINATFEKVGQDYKTFRLNRLY